MNSLFYTFLFLALTSGVVWAEGRGELCGSVTKLSEKAMEHAREQSQKASEEVDENISNGNMQGANEAKKKEIVYDAENYLGQLTQLAHMLCQKLLIDGPDPEVSKALKNVHESINQIGRASNLAELYSALGKAEWVAKSTYAPIYGGQIAQIDAEGNVTAVTLPNGKTVSRDSVELGRHVASVDSRLGVYGKSPMSTLANYGPPSGSYGSRSGNSAYGTASGGGGSSGSGSSGGGSDGGGGALAALLAAGALAGGIAAAAAAGGGGGEEEETPSLSQDLGPSDQVVDLGEFMDDNEEERRFQTTLVASNQSKGRGMSKKDFNEFMKDLREKMPSILSHSSMPKPVECYDLKRKPVSCHNIMAAICFNKKKEQVSCATSSMKRSH